MKCACVLGSGFFVIWVSKRFERMYYLGTETIHIKAPCSPIIPLEKRSRPWQCFGLRSWQGKGEKDRTQWEVQGWESYWLQCPAYDGKLLWEHGPERCSTSYQEENRCGQLEVFCSLGTISLYPTLSPASRQHDIDCLGDPLYQGVHPPGAGCLAEADNCRG